MNTESNYYYQVRAVGAVDSQLADFVEDYVAVHFHDKSQSEADKFNEVIKVNVFELTRLDLTDPNDIPYRIMMSRVRFFSEGKQLEISRVVCRLIGVEDVDGSPVLAYHCFAQAKESDK